MSEAEALLADSTLLRTSSGDPLVLVPLVFDSANLLHSPESFRELLIAIEAATTFPINPAVYFTDLAVFDSVIATTGSAASGRTHVEVYASGLQGSLRVAGSANSGAVPTSAEVYDPYVLPELEPPPCDPDDEGCGGGGGGGGGGGTYRPSTNASPDYGTTPSWPSLWKGDVISGDTQNGGGSSGTGNLGHTSIVTQLNGGGNTGGSITSYNTLVMEAIGKKGNIQDEVVQRAARIYWIDEGNRVNHVRVRYHPNASWTERDEAIAYARAQDPDNYNSASPKWWRYSWYCSKLAWAAYGEATGDDLDRNWGYWVFPEDIEGSRVLRSAYHFVYDPS